MTQQGRPFSSVFKFVFHNQRSEISLANRTTSVSSSSVIGRHRGERLDVYLPTGTKFVISLF